MRFEKWQALGNDYVDRGRGDLPFPLTPERIRALCAPHTGVGSDGVLLLVARPTSRGFVARLRIFNPDGSEAELSGNGAREAILYLRAAAGPIRTCSRSRPRRARSGRASPAPTPARMDMGRARAGLEGLPRRPATTAPARSRPRVASSRFQHVSSATRSARSSWRTGLEELDLARTAPPIERHDLFPQPHERLVLAPRPATARSAPASSSAAWGRRCPRARAPRRRRGRRAARADSPVTVHLDGGDLEVDVGEDLHVDLTGWAVPVYRGELDPRAF